MKRVLLAGATAVFLAATASAQTAPKLTPASASSSSAPRAIASSSLPIPDKGTFRILLSGAEVGTEQFEAEASGSARVIRSETVVRAPGQAETRSSGELRVTADGAPLGYKWTSQADKKASGSVEFTNGSAKTLLDLGNGKDPYQTDFMFSSPRVAVLDNNLYYQYALLAQLYDWNAGGQQAIPVLIPQDVTPGTITVESLGRKSVDGQTLEALRVNTSDIEVLAYYDTRHRLMRVEVPSAMVDIVRR